VVHRLAAAFMLLMVAFSQAETVLGELRDGTVHHESSTSAAVHALSGQGEHGHEDSARHGPEHQHGTSADHCTHQHGAQVNGRAVDLPIHELTYSLDILAPLLLLGRTPAPFFRPPRA
jgi:hypothetical protein